MILNQFYKEKRDLLYHTADGVVACKRKDEEKILHKHNLIIVTARPDGTSGDRQGTTKKTTQV